MTTTIEQGYQGYATAVVPANASEVQRKETRQAFFAGVMFMLATLSEISDESDQECDARISALRDELLQFRSSIGH